MGVLLSRPSGVRTGAVIGEAPFGVSKGLPCHTVRQLVDLTLRWLPSSVDCEPPAACSPRMRPVCSSNPRRAALVPRAVFVPEAILILR
ncbi:hypothetical protein FAIPA1_10286 [Frankia sp. AiPs1]